MPIAVDGEAPTDLVRGVAAYNATIKKNKTASTFKYLKLQYINKLIYFNLICSPCTIGSTVSTCVQALPMITYCNQR